MQLECQDSFHRLECIQLHRVRVGVGAQLQTDRVMEEGEHQNHRDEVGQLLRREEAVVLRRISQVVQTLGQGELIIEEEPLLYNPVVQEQTAAWHQTRWHS